MSICGEGEIRGVQRGFEPRRMESDVFWEATAVTLSRVRILYQGS